MTDIPVPAAGEAAAPADLFEAAPATADVPLPAVDEGVGVPPVAEAGTGTPRRRRRFLLRFGLAFLLGAGLVGGIGAGALYAWGLQYDGRILPGVHIGSTDLSGMTPDQARAAIAHAYASLATGQVVLNGPEGKTTVAFSDIGRGADTTALVNAALAAGRQGEPLADLIGGPQTALHGIGLPAAVTYDRAKLAAVVDGIAAQVNQPAISATLMVAPDGTYAVAGAKAGRAVDTAGLLASLDQRLSALDAPAQIALDVPIGTVAPGVPTSAAEDAKAAADRMIADLVIVRGTDSWVIQSSSLRPLLSFTPASDGSLSPTFNADGLDPLVAGLAKQINQTVQEAGLKLSGRHVVATGTSREGRTLDTVAMKTAIVNEIASRQAGTSNGPLPATVAAVEPKLSSANAVAYAAQMVPISSYSIYYWVLINNHWGGNIEGPANKINGTVVPAGGTFDFWKVVGDLHNIPGVGPGNAIEGGKITVTGAFGGGICTTSTTLFNAAFRAGMIPGARQNHNEFIDRYPPGLDATVWIVGNARQTMSFTNDTQYPILIQSAITYAGPKRWLTFKIWSVPNGRTYKISNLVIQPGAKAIDTTENDPTHPVGWSYRVNTPVDGAKVWVTVTIYDHGSVHWTKRYYSFYPPINGVLQVGTG